MNSFWAVLHEILCEVMKTDYKFLFCEDRESWQVAAPETSRCEQRAAVKAFTKSTYDEK